uniref:RING-type domain-containing protein n=1 Tax=Hyaloperonospora arabidopsidis (strain Emoy2) TaxID=559515 RepID=M4BBE4_HYAAE
MLFVPEDAACSSYRGYVRVQRREFAVRVSHVTHDASTHHVVLQDAQLDVDCALAARLKPHSATLKLRLAQASSLAGFGVEFEEIVAICCRKNLDRQVELPSAKYYARLLAELEVVGWQCLRQLTDDLRSLELEIKDQRGRNHVIQVLLPLQYDAEGFGGKPECLVDAPEPLELRWPPDCTKYSSGVLLDVVLKQFELFLDKFQAFWDVLDALDAATCVLEPQHPTRATGRRRVALDRRASVQFEVDPLCPAAMPRELSFFGNQVSVGALRELWGSSAWSRWDESRSMQANLEDVLNIKLPSPTTTKLEELAAECGICYAYRLEDGKDETNNKAERGSGALPMQSESKQERGSCLPDRLCENVKCNRPFHAKCLYDWLRALPTSRQSFHTIFGECPYCRDAISAKLEPDF